MVIMVSTPGLKIMLSTIIYIVFVVVVGYLSRGAFLLFLLSYCVSLFVFGQDNICGLLPWQFENQFNIQKGIT